MKLSDSEKKFLYQFLEKRDALCYLREIIDVTTHVSTNSNAKYYLPAVLYVILRYKYGFPVSPAELRAEGVGLVKTKFIVKVKHYLSLDRGENRITSDFITDTINRICSALHLDERVKKRAIQINEYLLDSGNRIEINEFFSYCASVVFVAARIRNNGEYCHRVKTGVDGLTQELIVRKLNISSHFLRKYTRFILNEMANFNL